MRICVIGAGSAGLAAARLAREEGHEVVVYEQSGKKGGLWNYSDEVGGHASIYKGLKTNVPRQVMQFSSLSFPSRLPSYVTAEDVLEYLVEYGRDVHPLFNHTVDRVQREGEQWKDTLNMLLFHVSVTDRHSGVSSPSSSHFDAVFVCNGHHFTPYQPLKDTSQFKGPLIHSHDFRRASDFRGQTVCVIGQGPSGQDCAVFISKEAERVILINRDLHFEFDGVDQVTGYVERLVENGALLTDGRVVEADSIVLCTGYRFAFPFLDRSLSELDHDDTVVASAYNHVLHRRFPSSLFYIGLLIYDRPAICHESQVRYCLSILAGRSRVPPEEELQSWYDIKMQSLIESGQKPKAFHFSYDWQWDYYKELAQKGGFKCLSRPVYKDLCDYTFYQRVNNLKNYKNINFKVYDNIFWVLNPEIAVPYEKEEKEEDDCCEKMRSGR